MPDGHRRPGGLLVTPATLGAWADRYLARLRQVDAAMVATGAPAISPRWWQTIERYVRSGRLVCLVRKGRRVGASSIVAPRLCVAFMLACPHRVPRGEYLTALFVSVRRSEAADRLRNVRAVLDVLGVAYEERGESLELAALGWVVRVGTANLAEVGGTYGWVWDDELTRQRDGETLRNPAGEVVRGFKPGTATVPGAQVWLVSSPLGLDDYHAREFERGDTDDQITDCFPTWEGNPTLSEEATHRLEPDPLIWQREYAAIPSASGLAPFDDRLVARTMRPLRPGSRYYQPIATIDPAARHDGFPVVIAGFVDEPTFDADNAFSFAGRKYLRDPETLCISPLEGKVTYCRKLAIHVCEVVGQQWLGVVSGKEILDRIAARCREWSVERIFSDQAQTAFVVSGLQEERGYRVTVADWRNASKIDAVARLRRMLADDEIVFPPDAAELRAEFRSYVESIAPTGTVRYFARGGAHDDRVSAVLGAVLAEITFQIPETPLRQAHRGKRVYQNGWLVWDSRLGGEL